MPRTLAAFALAVAVGTGALAACGPSQGEDTLTVELDGDRWPVLVATPDGMRDRDGFDHTAGMLFDLGEDVDPGAVVFVMDRVRLPLSIAWFSADGRLVGTATMPICPSEPCPRHAAPGRFRWAIEAPVGAFDALAPDARLVVPPS